MNRRQPNLVLIGFMGTGKSSIGRRCAQALGIPFRDTDTAVERRSGKPIPAIFKQDGEPEFRRLETEAIRFLCTAGPYVISTGGGAPMNPENVELMRANGVVILLTTDPEVILERTQRRESRPLLAGALDPMARIQELLAERQPKYIAAADCAIDTSNLALDQSVERVVAEYRERAA